MGTMVKVWKIPDRKVRPHFNLQVIGNINITNKRWGRGCKITISNAFGQHSLNKNVVIASQFGCAFFSFHAYPVSRFLQTNYPGEQW